MTASNSPDDPESDLPDFAAISHLYRRGDVPSPEILDARIRANARAAIQRQRLGRMSRWAAAASIVLVIGLIWRILDTPDARQAMVPAIPPTTTQTDLQLAQPAAPPASTPTRAPAEAVPGLRGEPAPEVDRLRKSARVADVGVVAPAAIPPERKARKAAPVDGPDFRSAGPRTESKAASVATEEAAGPPPPQALRQAPVGDSDSGFSTPAPAPARAVAAPAMPLAAPTAATGHPEAARVDVLLARIEGLPTDTRIGRGEERLTPADWARSLRLQLAEPGAPPASLARLYQLAEPYDLYFADQSVRAATGWLDAQQAGLSAEPLTP